MDLIDRTVPINVFMSSTSDGDKAGWCKFVLEKSPSAQQWIPCSTGLPEKEALCCDDRGDMIIGYPYVDKDSDTGFSAESDDIFLLNCVAWMPLPMPYKGRTE